MKTLAAKLTVFTLVVVGCYGQSNSYTWNDQQPGGHRFILSAPATISADFGATLPGSNAAGALTNNGSGVWSWTADLHLSGGTLTGDVFTHNLAPITDNTYSLGDSSHRWTDIRSLAATIGTLTVSSCTGCGGGGSFLPLAGGTMAGNVLWTNSSFSIGDHTTPLGSLYVQNLPYQTMFLGNYGSYTSTAAYLDHHTTSGTSNLGTSIDSSAGVNGTENIAFTNNLAELTMVVSGTTYTPLHITSTLFQVIGNFTPYGNFIPGTDNTYTWGDSTHRPSATFLKGLTMAGMASTDVSYSGSPFLTDNAFISATAASNASVGSFAATAGTGVDVSSGRTGSGTKLPLRFMINPSELARFDPTTGALFIHRTTDDGTGAVLQVGGNVSIDGSTPTLHIGGVGSPYVYMDRPTITSGDEDTLFFLLAGSSSSIGAYSVGLDNGSFMVKRGTGSGASQVMKIDSSGSTWYQGAVVNGLTSTDSGAGNGTFQGLSFGVITSASNSSAMILDEGGGTDRIRTTATGSGTVLPLAFLVNSTEVSRLTLGGIQLNGVTSTDASLNAGAILSSDALVSVSASSNAALGSFRAVSGNYVAFTSYHTGSGTSLPMTFFTGVSSQARRMTILPTGEVLVGLTSTSNAQKFQVSGGVNADYCYGCWGTNQNDVTGSRASGTIYQNTSGRAMHVSVGLPVSGAFTLTSQCYSDSAATPTVLVSQGGGAGGLGGTIFPMSFVVLNNNYYRCTSGNGTVTYWIESY